MAVFDDNLFDSESRFRHHGRGSNRDDFFRPDPKYPFLNHVPELYMEYERMLDNLFSGESECVTREYYRFDYKRKEALRRAMQVQERRVSKFKPDRVPHHFLDELRWTLRHMGDDNLPHKYVKERFEACVRCPKLAAAELSDELISKGYRAFKNCEGRVRIEVPEGEKVIDQFAFFLSDSLTNVKLPEGLRHIRYCAFSDCLNLSEINLPAGLVTIEHGAFMGCYSLSDIILPDSVSTIGPLAFLGCMNLTNIRIPRSVDVIDTAVFRGCYSLKSIELHDSIRCIKDNSFHECPSLRTVYIDCSPDSDYKSVLTYFGRLFPGCEVKAIFCSHDHEII